MAADQMRKTAMNNPDLRLFTKNSEDKWATMSFSVVTNGRKKDDNCMEIVVWTNETADADKNIKASLDIITVGIMIENIKNAIAATQEYNAPIIEFEATRWVKDPSTGKNKADGTFTTAKLHIGKDSAGRVYIALIAGKSGRPNLKFIFHKNKMRKLVNRDGTEPTEAQTSVLAAHAYVRVFEQYVYHLMVAGYTEPEQQQQGGGNYQGGGNNYNRQSQASSSSGDDIPF